MPAAPAAAHALGPPPRPSGWVLHWARQWRALLALLSATGLNCTRGWPPRPSTGLRCYGALTLLLRTSQSTVVVVSMMKLSGDGISRYGLLLSIYEIITKCGATVVTQLVMLGRHDAVCRLTESMLLYGRVGSPSTGWGALALQLVGPAYGFSLLAMVSVSMHVLATTTSSFTKNDLFYALGLGEMAPSVTVLMFWIMQLSMTSFSVGAALDESRHIRGWLSKHFLHDLVLQQNSTFGWCFLCGLVHVLVESVVCMYLVVKYCRMRIHQVEIKSRLLMNPNFFLWGFLEIMMFSGMCVLGHLLSDIHDRIFCDIQGFIVSNPQLLCPTTDTELHGFAQQIQRQDNRPGMFGLLYFDLTTMKA
ncbi:Gustatory receptor 78, partial [Frankliniella occidentalis]